MLLNPIVVQYTRASNYILFKFCCCWLLGKRRQDSIFSSWDKSMASPTRWCWIGGSFETPSVTTCMPFVSSSVQVLFSMLIFCVLWWTYLIGINKLVEGAGGAKLVQILPLFGVVIPFSLIGVRGWVEIDQWCSKEVMCLLTLEDEFLKVCTFSCQRLSAKSVVFG